MIHTGQLRSRQPLVKALLVPALLVLAFGATLLMAGDRQADAATTRHYYIAADEVDWDYAPMNLNNITGKPFGDEENVFVQSGPERIGKVYRKALYREYTDASFTRLKPRAPEWQHLGVLGPLIRAQVGDTIVVHFKNNTSIPVGVHPHGVFYEKDSEGADYNDGTSGTAKGDAGVAPGGTHVYSWRVPDRAGPGPGDPSSILWMYHSHLDEVRDTNSGLIGPIIISRKGTMRPDGRPRDVDREFVTLFTIFNENESWYLDYNMLTFMHPEPGGNPEGHEVARDDDAFKESNLMHSINGYVYGNLPGLTMRVGERVRWYELSLGTEVDVHTPHWHGATLLLGGTPMGQRTDMVEIFPGSMKVLDMKPDDPGTWLFHCHVNDHIRAGMIALFRVTR